VVKEKQTPDPRYLEKWTGKLVIKGGNAGVGISEHTSSTDRPCKCLSNDALVPHSLLLQVMITRLILQEESGISSSVGPTP
jgi:hypothetical protein